MSNTRGNTYSRGHLVYKEWQPEYWYTSIDTLALKDLPAMIDYTLNKTGAKKVAYVGHSQVRGGCGGGDTCGSCICFRGDSGAGTPSMCCCYQGVSHLVG